MTDCSGKLGVIFDMDGVLVDTGWAHRQAWFDLAAKEGLPMSDEFFRGTFGMQNAAILPMLRPGISQDEIERLSRVEGAAIPRGRQGASGAGPRDRGPAQRPQAARVSPGDRLVRPAGESGCLLGRALAWPTTSTPA